ncbi:MAG: FprA family A-type flavoprotein [Prevotellaceae bacterium]|jgi:flavorubredoxin|nr:FprA family A-type flavoprotein [Prevotellaceae bacterium]
MFKNIPIVPDVFYVGVNDRQKSSFENIIPLDKGVSYNSYLILDEKTALIDTVDVSQATLFIEKLQSQLQNRKLDYLIINHIEPDHSGAIGFLRKYHPEVTIVGNSKTLSMLEGFYGLEDNVLEIKEEETLSLGKHQLQFYMVPMVHWPETMFTYDKTAKILFSGDAFGSFGTLDGAVIDKDMNTDKYWDEMIRYYANVMGKYGSPVQKAMQKVSALSLNYICSTHGPVWHERIPEALKISDRLSKYEGEEGVVVVYGSMYGNTELMAETVAQGLAEAGVREVAVHNISKSDPSYILRDIFKYKGLIIGSPTYNNELHPEIEPLLRKIEIRGIKNRVFGYFGSFSWAGAAVKRMSAFAEKTGWSVAATVVEQKLGLKEDNYNACLQLGREVAGMLKKEVN